MLLQKKCLILGFPPVFGEEKPGKIGMAAWDKQVKKIYFSLNLNKKVHTFL